MNFVMVGRLVGSDGGGVMALYGVSVCFLENQALDIENFVGNILLLVYERGVMKFVIAVQNFCFKLV